MVQSTATTPCPARRVSEPLSGSQCIFRAAVERAQVRAAIRLGGCLYEVHLTESADVPSSSVRAALSAVPFHVKRDHPTREG